MVVRCKTVVDMTRSVSGIFVIKVATGWWLAHVNWIHNKHSSLFPKVQSVFKLDHFLETMEMKSLKKNLALKITILHLLRDPIIFKEGAQSLEGIATGLRGLIWTNLHNTQRSLRQSTLHEYSQ